MPPSDAPSPTPDVAPAKEAAGQLASELAAELADVGYALRLAPDVAFEYMSPSVERLTGWTAADYYADAGLAIANTPPDQEAEIKAAFAAPPGHVSEFTVQWIRRDGQPIWTHHRCRTAVRDDGSLIVYAAARDVTAQHEAERALAASQEMYRLLAENASDVVWRTNLEAVVEWVSPSIVSVMGWLPSDLVGGTILDHVHPDDIDEVRTATSLANEGGRVSFEARYRCKDSSYRWLEITARPLVDENGVVVGKVGSCRDVHSEIEAWHALERSEQRFRLAMESAPTGMAVLGLDSQFIEVNAELCRMLGFSQEWLLNHPLTHVVHPADEENCRGLRDEVLSGRRDTATTEVRLIDRDHAIVWAQVSLGLVRDEEGIPNSLVAQMVNITDAHDSREALRFMASHDPMTQLLNRRELLVQMSTILAHRQRGDGTMAVLFCDLDGLKQANDTLGHAAGDQLIIEAGRRIAAHVRDGDLAARIGGDEFVAALPEVHGLEDALRVAVKICDAIQEPLFVAGTEVPLGVSIGVCVARKGDDANALLRKSDAALYRAKAAGRNRIEAYDPALDD